MCEQGLLKGVNPDIGICRFALLDHSVTWRALSQSLASGLGVHGARSQAPTIPTPGRPLSPAQNHPGSTSPGSREMRWGQGAMSPAIPHACLQPTSVPNPRRYVSQKPRPFQSSSARTSRPVYRPMDLSFLCASKSGIACPSFLLFKACCCYSAVTAPSPVLCHSFMVI